MGIFRVKKDNNYSVINNTGLKDDRLSWKAKGILAYALTLPDDWTFHISELSQHAKDGEDSLRTGINELKKLGYVKRYPVRDKKTKKITSWETEIYETPHREIPLVEKPYMENLEVEKPLVENPTLLSTNKQSTKELNTNLLNTNHHDDHANIKSQKLIDEEFKTSYNFLLKNGIALSEIAITELGEFCNTLGSELIIEAVNRSIDENVPKWRYVRGILMNWEKKKVKTMEDVSILDSQFEISKQNKKNTGVGYGKRKEVVPDWLRQQENENPEQQFQEDIDEQRKRLEAELKKYK
ncbi:DnaD domain protein [Bacillus pseudomycoides]|uniref:DnaD domain protein n=1 Tax=Bacillus pseudomycoides TaxID=64104 RepID=UPI000BF7B5D2|nr:DnaD domain protein [Bacillus pseudomycoides]MED1539117.1 DnaD domain protein [Bacillus pseudomycoides]PGC41448.1 DNA-binding protein [Bacillus pseudomycoides]